MTVITRTVHRHRCATCNGEFNRRNYPSGEPSEFCVCREDWASGIELCDPCRKSIGEAGFIGDLVMRMLEHMIAHESSIDALAKDIAALKAPAPATTEETR